MALALIGGQVVLLVAFWWFVRRFRQYVAQQQEWNITVMDAQHTNVLLHQAHAAGMDNLAKMLNQALETKERVA